MHPVLIELFGYKVKTYGFIMSAAHLLGVAAFLLLIRSKNKPVSVYVDLLLVVFLSGLIGARATYVIGHWSEFENNPLNVLALWEGGLSFHGGFLLTFLAYLLFLGWKKLSVWETSDLGTPILFFTLGLIRIGCLGAGCCHGLPTSLPWGLHFSSELIPEEYRALPLHPTQIYEAVVLFSLSGIAFLLLLKKKLPAGVIAAAGILSYSIARFFLDSLRGDINPQFLSWLTFSQGVALLLILTGIPILTWRYHKGTKRRLT